MTDGQGTMLSPQEHKVQALERTDVKTENVRLDNLWAVEAEDRIDAFERGELKSIPASEVFAQIERDRNDSFEK